jgi:elongation factor P
MISTSDFRNGQALLYKDEPWVIVKFQHVNPGKGSAFTRTRIKNLKNGKVLEETFKSGEKFDDPNMLHKRLQFLYADDANCYFMDEKYEQYQLSKEIVGDQVKFMKEECQVDGLFMGESLFNVALPPKLDFKVTEAPPGVKGDTATNVFKLATIETGAQVSVPLFVNQGDTIRVNTETGEYVSRV